MLGWACALGILGLSAPIICSSEFFYTQNIYRRSDELCSLCFENDCLTLDKARCDYYAEADSIVPKDEELPRGTEDAAKRNEVDDLMFELVEKGLYNNMECIPYVSRYTNCNKANVCLGCKTCACNPEGRWNCTIFQPCHSQDPSLNIDHRVLVMVMEAITDHTHPRMNKRSVTDNPKGNASTVIFEQLSEWLYGAKPSSLKEIGSRDFTSTTAFTAVEDDNLGNEVAATVTDSHPRIIKRSVTDNPKGTASTVTFEQLSEWLYGAKHSSLKEIGSRDFTSTTAFTAVEDDKLGNEVAATVTDPSSSLTGLTTTEEPETTTTEDTDPIVFEEVLRNIAVDLKNDNRRKLIDYVPFDNNRAEFPFDYMTMDEDNATEGSSNNVMSNMMNFMLDFDDSELTVTEPTEVVIDLLETAGSIDTNVNVTEDFTNYTKDEDPNIFENMNDIIEHSAFNIMKRDVAGQENKTAPNVMPTATIIVNTTNITTSTNTTENSTELRENVLIPLNIIISEKIRELENLQKIKYDLLKFVKQPDDKPKDNNITSNTYFSIYNVAVATGLDVDLKRANPNKYEKYMFKLKSDIFEVLRDIYGIRKYRNLDIPDDLKLLVHAMKRYVYKTNFFEKPKRNKLKRLRSLRRRMEPTGRCGRLSLKECLVQVIEVIDQDTPKLNALYPLSLATRKIMKHIINSYYVNQFIMPVDPHYNLTNFLNSIGNRWQEVTASLIGSTPFASLYRMKLLHCSLTMDISKMNDAIGIIEFSHSRRMTDSLDKVRDSTFDRIDAGLTMIHNKILMLIKYYSRKPETQVSRQSRAVMKLNTETTTKPQVNVQTTINYLPEIRKKKKHSFIKHIRSLLKTSKHDIKKLLQEKVPKSEIVRQLAKKRLDEISDKRYREYEETMKRWQKNLKLAKRMKRTVTDQFKTRIKNIIPRYLRHKVTPKIKENQKNATAAAERKADVRKKNRKEEKASRRERKTRKTTTPSSKAKKTTTPSSKAKKTKMPSSKANKTTTPSSRKLAKPGVRAKIITTRPTTRTPTRKKTKLQ